MLVVYDIFQFADKPRVNLGQFIDAFDVTFFQCLCNGKDTLGQSGWPVHHPVGEAGVVIAHKSVHALSNHTKTFLDDFFKRTSDRHDFPTDFMLEPMR